MHIHTKFTISMHSVIQTYIAQSMHKHKSKIWEGRANVPIPCKTGHLFITFISHVVQFPCTYLWKGLFRSSNSVDFWYLRISLSATVPFFHRLGFFTPPVFGAFLDIFFTPTPTPWLTFNWFGLNWLWFWLWRWLWLWFCCRTIFRVRAILKAACVLPASRACAKYTSIPDTCGHTHDG